MAKILLVEDDNNLREIYQARLVAEGYDIVAAQNGEEALVVAKQNKPDLIISDVMMPRISGFEMLDILRNTEELKHTRVIMLTALGQAEDQKRAGNLGADRYLVKSQVTLEDIVNAAQELLSEEGLAPAPATAEQPAAPAESAAAPTAEPASTPVAPATVAPVAMAEAPAPADTSAPAVPSPVVDAPPAPAAATPAPEPSGTPTPSVSSAPADAVVPASVVPQADTTVVVPPAPANPTPPTVTTAPLPPASTDAIPAPSEPPTAPAVDTAAPSTATAASTVADAATETLEKEEAELQAQIDNYAKQPAETPLAVEPAPDDDATQASNDQTLASAVETLNAPTEEPPLQPPSVTSATASVEPAPAPASEAVAPETPTDNVNVVGKKVIQPINSVEKPDLNKLLEKEEAQAIVNAPAAPTVMPAAPAAAPTPPAPTPAPPSAGSTVPGQSFDPNKAL